ncbi:hypothetical protein F4810DRAFT_417676 [Camillea tinctor]|nr:hypothetical protein F4810DRAFT_417676 [Camillea tinctor]
MTNLPSQHPSLSLHLTDRSLTPLITSSRTPSQHQSLTSLSHTALSALESAQRLGLGVPQRIMVEHAPQHQHQHSSGGPVLLQMFLASSTPSFPSSAPGGIGSGSGTSDDHASGSTRTSTSQLRTGIEPTAASASSAAAQQLSSLSLSGEPARLRGGATLDNDPSDEEGGEEEEEGGGGVGVGEEDADAPPMLLGVVVAPTADEALEARRAAAKLERVGREIQARWTEAQGRRDGEDGVGE